MAIDPNNKGFLSLVPFTLPLALVLPYAFVASRFRGLIWVWETGNRPFWITLACLLLLSVSSALLLNRLQRFGSTLYRVGIVLSTVETAYLAMSERRHSLLVLVFLLFAGQVLLSETVKKVLRLPFFDSRRHWWEGCPKAIPGLQVEVSSENGDTKEVRLANFGLEGCFVFSQDGAISFAPKMVRVFNGEQTLLEADVDVVERTNDGYGWGLRFGSSALEGDWSKDLQDYLGYLRRSGYEIA